MKKVNFFIAILIFAGLFFPISNTAAQSPTAQTVKSTMVKFYVKNNSILPHRFIIKLKDPSENGHGSHVGMWLPFQTNVYEMPVGSTVEKMRSSDVAIMMNGQGNSIFGKMIVQVKASDAGKTFKLW